MTTGQVIHRFDMGHWALQVRTLYIEVQIQVSSKTYTLPYMLQFHTTTVHTSLSSYTTSQTVVSQQSTAPCVKSCCRQRHQTGSIIRITDKYGRLCYLRVF